MDLGIESNGAGISTLTLFAFAHQASQQFAVLCDLGVIFACAALP